MHEASTNDGYVRKCEGTATMSLMINDSNLLKSAIKNGKMLKHCWE